MSISQLIWKFQSKCMNSLFTKYSVLPKIIGIWTFPNSKAKCLLMICKYSILLCRQFALCYVSLWLRTDCFIHILQVCFTGTGAIIRLPRCQWSNPEKYGRQEPIKNWSSNHKNTTELCACFMRNNVYYFIPSIWFTVYSTFGGRRKHNGLNHYVYIKITVKKWIQWNKDSIQVILVMAMVMFYVIITKHSNQFCIRYACMYDIYVCVCNISDVFQNHNYSSLNMYGMTQLLIFAVLTYLMPFIVIKPSNLVLLLHLVHNLDYNLGFTIFANKF